MTLEQVHAICEEASAVAAEFGIETTPDQLMQILDEAQDLE